MMLISGIAAFAQEVYVSSPIVKAMEGGKFYMKLGAVQAISDADIKADKIQMTIETATKGGVSMARTHMQLMDAVVLSTPEGSFRLDESAKTWTAQPMASASFTGGKLKFIRQGSCRINGQDGWFFDEYKTPDGSNISFYYNSDKVSVVELGDLSGEGLGPMSLLSFSTFIPSNMYFCVGRDWKQSSGTMDPMAIAGIDRATIEKQIRDAMKDEELPPGMTIESMVDMAMGQMQSSTGAKNPALPGPPVCAKPWTDSGSAVELACGGAMQSISISGRQNVSSPVLAANMTKATVKKQARTDLNVTREGVKLALEQFLAQSKGKTPEQIERSIINYADTLCGALLTGTITGELAESAIARCHVYPHPTILNTTGTMLMELDDPTHALEYFEKAEEYQPDYAEALYGQVECHLDMGNIEKARKVVPKILEKTPDGFQDGRAWLYKAMLEEDSYARADALFKSVSLGFFDENSALLFTALLNGLDVAEMHASHDHTDFMSLLNRVFSPENLDNLRKGITWSRTEKFESSKKDFTATPAVNLESNWRMNQKFGEQDEAKGQSSWNKANKAHDESVSLQLCMAMGFTNLGDNIQNIYDNAKEMPEVKSHIGNARVAKTVRKLNVSDNARSNLENAYKTLTRSEGMKYGVDGFYVPDDRTFWCLWALERYYNFRISYLNGDFAYFDDDRHAFVGFIPDANKERVRRNDAITKKYDDLNEALQKKHMNEMLEVGKKCEDAMDKWIKNHPEASDSTYARAERRIYKPYRILVLVTHPLEYLDKITIPSTQEELQVDMDVFNQTFKPLYNELWADMSKYPLYYHDPAVAKYFWFRALSEVYSGMSSTYYAKATAGESFERTRNRHLHHLANLEGQDWKDHNADVADFQQRLKDEDLEREFPENYTDVMSDFTFDINLPSGTIRIGLVDGKLGMDIDTETKFWERKWAEYDAQVTGKKVQATGTDNNAVMDFIKNAFGAMGMDVSASKLAETLLSYTDFAELGGALKVAGPLDIAMKAREGKLVQTSSEYRHGGFICDSAGNLHRRDIKSNSIDFNGKLKITDEIHQVGRVKKRKMLATYNSGGIFSFTIGGFDE